MTLPPGAAHAPLVQTIGWLVPSKTTISRNSR
jgi:hypothetical protein